MFPPSQTPPPVAPELDGRTFNGGMMSAGEIAGTFSHAWQTTTRHLQVLERAGLLSCEKKGRMRIYRIEKKRLELVKDWLDHFFRKP